MSPARRRGAALAGRPMTTGRHEQQRERGNNGSRLDAHEFCSSVSRLNLAVSEIRSVTERPFLMHHLVGTRVVDRASGTACDQGAARVGSRRRARLNMPKVKHFSDTVSHPECFRVVLLRMLRQGALNVRAHSSCEDRLRSFSLG